jgi:competence protein ComEA
MTPPGVAPSAVPAPLAASRGSATKTMFGIPAPSLPEGFTTLNAAAPAPVAAARVAEPAAPVEASSGESDTGRTDRIAKTGARKVAVPAPEIVVVPAAAPTKDVGRTTHFGFETGATAAKKLEDSKTDKADKSDKSDKSEKTKPTRAPAAAKPPGRQAPIWTYVGVGFTFGLALLGIYQLVGRLAH